ncbi:MAG: tetratricopeptide repeat protein [Planctomycetes bacterium]|nr:tetratricopeptide repeat protein [Planctomycetota bacterium]
MIRKPLAGGGLALTLLLLAPAPCAAVDHLRNVQPGQPLPSFQCSALDGPSLGSKDVAGRALVLVYLSAGQKQSERALPVAHKVVANIKSEGLTLVYMSADTDRADYFRKARRTLEIDQPLLFDEGRNYHGQLGLIAFPTTIVTSKDGKLLHVIASWTRSYEHCLDLYCRHALGELDEATLAARMAASPAFRDEARGKADRHRSVAAILRSKGMIAGAVRELEQALELDPDCADAAVELADLLVAQGQLDQAEQRIDELLTRKPDYQGAKLVLGLISLKRGQLDRAERLLTEALKMNLDRVRAHYYLGQLYERKGEYQAAMEHYRDALRHALKEP